jgi:hypothetical protein
MPKKEKSSSSASEAPSRARGGHISIAPRKKAASESKAEKVTRAMKEANSKIHLFRQS